MTDDVVDMRPLKKRIAALWPPGNAFRETVLSEPDVVPRVAFDLKLESYIRMLCAMRDEARRSG